jgi:hypothetical protein
MSHTVISGLLKQSVVIDVGSFEERVGLSNNSHAAVPPPLMVRPGRGARRDTARQHGQAAELRDFSADLMDVLDAVKKAVELSARVVAATEREGGRRRDRASAVAASSPVGLSLESWDPEMGGSSIQRHLEEANKGKIDEKDKSWVAQIAEMENAGTIDALGVPMHLVLPRPCSRDEIQAYAQAAFEQCNAPALVFSPAPMLACHAAGKVTALVVDFGRETTRVTPVIDGLIPSGTHRVLPIGGLTLAQYLVALADARHGISLTVAAAERLVGAAGRFRLLDVKLPLLKDDEAEAAAADAAAANGTPAAEPIASTVAQQAALRDYPAEPMLPPLTKREASLASTLSKELTEITEIFFDPVNLLGAPELVSLPDVVTEVARLATVGDPDRRAALLGTIIPIGKLASLPGANTRLLAELMHVRTSTVEPAIQKVFTLPSLAAFTGAMHLSNLAVYRDMMTVRQSYDDDGPSCMLKRTGH